MHSTTRTSEFRTLPSAIRWRGKLAVRLPRGSCSLLSNSRSDGNDDSKGISDRTSGIGGATTAPSSAQRAVPFVRPTSSAGWACGAILSPAYQTWTAWRSKACASTMRTAHIPSARRTWPLAEEPFLRAFGLGSVDLSRSRNCIPRERL